MALTRYISHGALWGKTFPKDPTESGEKKGRPHRNLHQQQTQRVSGSGSDRLTGRLGSRLGLRCCVGLPDLDKSQGGQRAFVHLRVLHIFA